MVHYTKPRGVRPFCGRHVAFNFAQGCIEVWEDIARPGWWPVWERIATITTAEEEAEWFDQSRLTDDEYAELAYFWLDLTEATKQV